jgi:Bacterial regulatory proteins, gntR family
MRQPSIPKNANEAQEKVPFLVAKRIREAILDEVFKPGDDLGEVGLAEKFEVSRLLKHFPTARPAEILVEIYRKGKIAESFQAFKKIYLEILDEVIDQLKRQEAGDSSRRRRFEHSSQTPDLLLLPLSDPGHCVYKLLIHNNLEARGVEPLSLRSLFQTSTCVADLFWSKRYGSARVVCSCVHEITLVLQRGHSAFRPACCRRVPP